MVVEKLCCRAGPSNFVAADHHCCTVHDLISVCLSPVSPYVAPCGMARQQDSDIWDIAWRAYLPHAKETDIRGSEKLLPWERLRLLAYSGCQICFKQASRKVYWCASGWKPAALRCALLQQCPVMLQCT